MDEKGACFLRGVCRVCFLEAVAHVVVRTVADPLARCAILPPSPTRWDAPDLVEGAAKKFPSPLPCEAEAEVAVEAERVGGMGMGLGMGKARRGTEAAAVADSLPGIKVGAWERERRGNRPGKLWTCTKMTTLTLTWMVSEAHG